jgi:hypothetical protein
MPEQQVAVDELARPAVDVDQVERWTVVGGQPAAGIIDDELSSWIVADHAAGHGLGRPVDLDGGQPRGRVHAREQPRGADTGAGTQFQDAPARLGRGQGTQQRAGAVLTGHRKADLGRAPLGRQDHGRHVKRFVDHAGSRSASACWRSVAATSPAP